MPLHKFLNPQDRSAPPLSPTDNSSHQFSSSLFLGQNLAFFNALFRKRYLGQDLKQRKRNGKHDQRADAYFSAKEHERMWSARVGSLRRKLRYRLKSTATGNDTPTDLVENGFGSPAATGPFQGHAQSQNTHKLKPGGAVVTSKFPPDGAVYSVDTNLFLKRQRVRNSWILDLARSFRVLSGFFALLAMVLGNLLNIIGIRIKTRKIEIRMYG